ncbi:unnamed protein product [Zymoseptoria tritici ST99CH_1A5]|uniref:Putative zinc-finger domain-containing protein n=1 Tax=Zymoseptoria tritici ST99CH_1A5 TaxID=1276529 RepID=A0A1Y6LD39_ZYMTR|nr:unnamed protein product [Zymoseptoria tritici ST99CH_3D1]SMY22343.1 unnamed protein product [Zymoseptoria tritici ST99CH_1A5]
MTPQQAAASYGAGGHPPSTSNTSLPTHYPQRDYNPFHAQTSANGTPSATSQGQQMAFGQNAALPGFDMSILQGITPDQLALIARLIQTGTLPLPPGAPGSQVSNTATPPGLAPPTQPAVVSNDAIDREDGEVDEGEVSDHQPRDFLSTPPKGPRQNRSPTILEKKARGVLANLESQSSSRRGSSQKTNLAAPPNAPRGPSGLANGQSNTRAPNGMGGSAPIAQLNTRQPSPPSKRDTLKEFVLEMHRAGYGFEQIAKEVGNTPALRRLYGNLQLAVPSADNAPAARANGSVSPFGSEQRPSTAAKRPVSKPAPADRSAYLAKLQAAKNKKSESMASTPINQAADSVLQVASSAQPILPVEETRVEPQLPRAAPPKKTIKTELVRQRLEALNAARAKQNVQVSMSDPVPATPSFQQAELGQRSACNGSTIIVNAQDNGTSLDSSGTGDQPSAAHGAQESHSEPAMQPIPTPASPSISRGFGLPGLFTTRASATPTFSTFAKDRTQTPEVPRTKSNQSPIVPLVMSTIQRPQQIASLAAPSRQSSATQQPFGQPNHLAESFIIEASSDEEDDREDDEAPSGTSLKTTTKQSPPGNLRDFPPKYSVLGPASASTPGTPGLDLKRKLEEVEEMKRKIARLETRKTKSKSNAQAAKAVEGDSSASSMPESGSVTPANAVQSNPQAKPLIATPANKMRAAEQEKESLKRRLLELQAQGVDIPPATRAPAQTLPPAVEHQEPTTEQNESEMDEDDFYNEEPSDTAADTLPDSTQSRDVTMTNATENASNEPEHSSSTESIEGGELGTASLLAPGFEQAAMSTRLEESSTTFSARANVDAQDPDPPDDDEDEDMDDVYEPQPGPVPSSIVDVNPSESGSADDAGAPIPAEEVDPSNVSPNDADDDTDDNGDDYEPSQNIETADEVAAPSPASTDAMSESASMSESEESTSGEQSTAQSPDVDLVADLQPDPDVTNPATDRTGIRVVDDGLAPELQPASEQHVVVHQQPQAESGFYKPYTSPLSRFKDFRFHPSFLEAVSGHKSLTYSHRIDPNKQLCPYEVGGRCNDKSCGFQHFKTMDLSDNDLLRILGTERMPASDPESQQRWRTGLHALIKELRITHKTQDVDVIAQRIADFRREFIGDPTKTLLLKDT